MSDETGNGVSVLHSVSGCYAEVHISWENYILDHLKRDWMLTIYELLWIFWSAKRPETATYAASHYYNVIISHYYFLKVGQDYQVIEPFSYERT